MNRGLDMLLHLNDRAARNAEERMLLSAVNDVAQAVIAPAAEEVDEAAVFPQRSMEAINDLDLNLMFLPEPYGLGSVSFACYLECVRAISEACATTGITWATNFHAISPIVDFGTPDQWSRILPTMVDGGLASLCITEPEAGSDASAMTLTIRPDGDHVVISGSKAFITNGDRSDILLVFGKWTEIADPRAALTAVMVERPVEGLYVGRLEHKLGHRGSSTASLTFDSCRVPRSNILGEPGGGGAILRTALNKSRPSVAAHALGIATAAIKDAVRYVNERQQFGQSIASYQHTQFVLADLMTDLAFAVSWMDRLAERIDAGSADIAVEASMLKVRATDLAMRAAVEAVQLHGGYGYTTDHRVERLMRDAKVTQIWEGTNEIHRQFIGRQFLDR